MKVYLVRHGEKEKGSFYNEKIRHQDQPLSRRGMLQAEGLTDYFRDLNIEEIRVSEYVRTRQTAGPLARSMGLNMTEDPRLNEIDSGIIESLTENEIKVRYPDFWRDYWAGDGDYRFPGGETGEEVRCRQESLLRELIEGNRDTVLITHEGYIRLFMCTILGLPVYRRHVFGCDPCGISEVNYDIETKEWRIIRFNQV